MLNTDIKVNRKDYGVCECKCKGADPNDAKLQLTMACGAYVNAVAPDKKFDGYDLGNAVADFINDYLCLNPDDIPQCTKLFLDINKDYEKYFKGLEDFVDARKFFDDVANDGKWHNTKHVDKPGLKIDEWVKKHIG